MRNLLLLFINVLVFSSISFSQISPPSGNRCQNQTIAFLINSPVFVYSWNFTGVPFTFVGGTNQNSPFPQINCSSTGTLIVTCIADGIPQTPSIITINPEPPNQSDCLILTSIT